MCAQFASNRTEERVCTETIQWCALDAPKWFEGAGKRKVSCAGLDANVLVAGGAQGVVGRINFFPPPPPREGNIGAHGCLLKSAVTQEVWTGMDRSQARTAVVFGRFKTSTSRSGCCCSRPDCCRRCSSQTPRPGQTCACACCSHQNSRDLALLAWSSSPFVSTRRVEFCIVSLCLKAEEGEVVTAAQSAGSRSVVAGL